MNYLNNYFNVFPLNFSQENEFYNYKITCDRLGREKLNFDALNTIRSFNKKGSKNIKIKDLKSNIFWYVVDNFHDHIVDVIKNKEYISDKFIKKYFIEYAIKPFGLKKICMFDDLFVQVKLKLEKTYKNLKTFDTRSYISYFDDLIMILSSWGCN